MGYAIRCATRTDCIVRLRNRMRTTVATSTIKNVANDDLSELRTTVRLTRSEAARYVGASGESTIRAAEANGLACERDWEGQVWHAPLLLDAWKWRSKAPTAAQKARVLREAANARARDQREHLRRQAAESERVFAELDAEREQDRILRERELALREEVRRQNEETRAAFESAYMGEDMAGKALGFRSYEARYRLRDLVGRGLLRRFDGPREMRVEMSFDGLLVVETQWPLCAGGPFFLRDEVLALRHEAADIEGRHLGAMAGPDASDWLAAALRLVAENAGRGSSPR